MKSNIMKHSLIAISIASALALFGCNSTDAQDDSTDLRSSSSQANSAVSSSATSSSASSSSQVTITESGKGVWKINGTLTANEDISSLSFGLYRGDTRIKGAIYAYEVKDIKAKEGLETLLEVNFGAAADGVHGLDATIYQSDMGAVCAEGETTVVLDVRITGKVLDASSITGAIELLDVGLEPMVFAIDCATEAVASGSNALTDATREALLKDLEDLDPTAELVESSFELGGAIAAIGSSLDLDAGKTYGSNEVDDLVDDIDLIYSGTAIMTPYGAWTMGYMTKKYMASTSAATIFAVADSYAAQNATKLEDLLDFITDSPVDYVDGLASGQYYLVVSSDALPYLISIATVENGKQILTIKSHGWTGE
jgi:hypothetical protein